MGHPGNIQAQSNPYVVGQVGQVKQPCPNLTQLAGLQLEERFNRLYAACKTV